MTFDSAVLYLQFGSSMSQQPHKTQHYPLHGKPKWYLLWLKMLRQHGKGTYTLCKETIYTARDPIQHFFSLMSEEVLRRNDTWISPQYHCKTEYLVGPEVSSLLLLCACGSVYLVWTHKQIWNSNW